MDLFLRSELVEISSCIRTMKINPLQDDKILDWSKWKQTADILRCIQNEK